MKGEFNLRFNNLARHLGDDGQKLESPVRVSVFVIERPCINFSSCLFVCFLLLSGERDSLERWASQHSCLAFSGQALFSRFPILTRKNSQGTEKPLAINLFLCFDVEGTCLRKRNPLRDQQRVARRNSQSFIFLCFNVVKQCVTEKECDRFYWLNFC